MYMLVVIGSVSGLEVYKKYGLAVNENPEVPRELIRYMV
jgi:hypothetical protein